MKIKHLDELIGKEVVVTADHGTLGYLVAADLIANRRIGTTGRVVTWVPGHGGDVVLVEQAVDGHGAVYCLDELEFFSPEALQFAALKAYRVAAMEKELKKLKEEKRPGTSPGGGPATTAPGSAATSAPYS